MCAFWTTIGCSGADIFHGGRSFSVAHALGRRLTSASIASGVDYPRRGPYGSHPLLDSIFSSYGLRIHHDCPGLSRFAKTKILSEWETGLRHLHVCNQSEYYRSGMLNCGRCEKCLRTLTALSDPGQIGLGRELCPARVTPELILANAYINKMTFPFWDELVGPLEEAGHEDLARAVKRRISLWRGETGWRGPLRRFDRMHLNGVLRYLKRNTSRTRPVRRFLKGMLTGLNRSIRDHNTLVHGCDMIIEARNIDPNASLDSDVCIVGGGTAGITLAREFIGQQFRVCLLESGGALPEPETRR